MLYSCFNPKSGQYDYWQDSRERAINADLPTPDLASSTPIGAPAMDSGRDLPRDAKRAGSGWHARGSIVQCSGKGSLSGLLDESAFGAVLFAVGGAAAGACYISPKLPRTMRSGTRTVTGALVGAGLGYLALKMLGEVF